MSGVLIGFAVLFGIIYGLATLAAWRKRDLNGAALSQAASVAMGEILKRTGGYARLIPYLHRQQAALNMLLEKDTRCPDRLFHWTAETSTQSFAVLTVFAWLAVLAGNAVLLGIGLLTAIVVAMQRARLLSRQVELRKRAILLELPEVASRIALLIGGGESVRRALERSAFRGNATKSHPLYVQLNAALAALDRGESFAAALEEFGRRCAVPEAKQLGTVLLLNARRGGETLLPALRELSRTLWEKRKATALTIGEQASARLAFPMAVVFLIVMALAGAPALLLL